MERISFIVTTVCTLITTTAIAQEFHVYLTGNQQPLPVLTTASGHIDIDVTGDSLSLSGSFGTHGGDEDSTLTFAAFLMRGLPGEVGDTVHQLALMDIDSTGNLLMHRENNQILMDSIIMEALDMHQLYINVISSVYPAGFIRGPVFKKEARTFDTHLLGSDDVLGRWSRGHGTLVLSLDGENTIRVSGALTGYELSQAESPCLRIVSQDGEVLDTVAMQYSPDSMNAYILPAHNSFEVSAEDISRLENEGWMASLELPQGVRAQSNFSPPALAKFQAMLSGVSLLPATLSSGSGQIRAALRGDSLTLSGLLNRVEGEMEIDTPMSLNRGMAGQQGPVISDIKLELDSSANAGRVLPGHNTMAITESEKAALIERGLYINVTSSAFPDGELRGQLLPRCQRVFNALLTGAQHLPSVTALGHATASIELLGDQLTFTGSYSCVRPYLDSSSAGALLHAGAAGTTGPIFDALHLSQSDSSSGVWYARDNVLMLRKGWRDSLLNRQFYLSVPTSQHPMGEIRGQILPAANAYYFAPISGAEAVPVSNSENAGAFLLELHGETAVMSGSIHLMELVSDSMSTHFTTIHNGLAGMQGAQVGSPLSLMLTKDRSSIKIDTPAVVMLDRGMGNSLRYRKSYAEILDLKGGALRGQFRPVAQQYFLANLDGRHVIPPSPSAGSGTLLLEKFSNRINISGSISKVETYAPGDSSQGVFLFTGGLDSTGSVLWSLVPDSTCLMPRAEFLAERNAWMLSDSLTDLLDGGKIHVRTTVDTAATAVRGQFLREVNLHPFPVRLVAMNDSTSQLGDTALTITWEPSMDPNDNDIVYLLQLGFERRFTQAALSVNVGDHTSFILSRPDLDTIIAHAGLDSSTVLPLYYRVMASDGSLISDPSIDSLQIVRPASAPVSSSSYFGGAHRLFPNPVQDHFTLELQMEKAADVQVMLVDASGRPLLSDQHSLEKGTNRIDYEVTRFPAGSYFIHLAFDQRAGLTIPLNIQ